MIHVVTLERVPVRVVPDFVEAIRTNSRYFWAAMQNVWLVDTELRAKELSGKLRAHIGAADSLLVVRLREDYGGLMKPDAWKWLKRSAVNGSFD